MDIKISIVTLTKNRARFLQKNLESLADQTVKPEEVVVVDNMSIDDTSHIVNRFQTTLPIRYKRTKTRGYPALYNAGIRLASGKWIAFLDDDCIASPRWLREIYHAIERHPKAAIQGNTQSIPAGNMFVDIMGDHYMNWIRVNSVSQNLLKTFDNKNLCIPRSIISKYGAFDESLVFGSEDIELGARYFNHGVPIFYNPHMLAYHHERDTFAGFVRQHIRIAKSEAIVDHRLDTKQRVTLVRKEKLQLNLISGGKRFIHHFGHGEPVRASKVVVAYISLALIRFWTYHMTAWKEKKSA